MSCTCQTSVSPSGEPLPLVSDDCPVSLTSSLTNCCTDPESLPSTPSEGATLPAWATDAACYDSSVTLLGRVGNKLARLVGSGFLAVTNGAVSVVSSVPLTVQRLWHRWWKSSPTASPVLGAPLDFPYHVIADSTGNLFGIKGGDVDAVHLWDASANAWTTAPVSDLPSCVAGVLTTATGIELVGYTPLGENDPLTTTRCRKGLSGAGLVYLTEVDTAPVDCECNPFPGTASVANTLPPPEPTGAETYTLKFSTALGLHWAEDETPN